MILVNLGATQAKRECKNADNVQAVSTTQTLNEQNATIVLKAGHPTSPNGRPCAMCVSLESLQGSAVEKNAIFVH